MAVGRYLIYLIVQTISLYSGITQLSEIIHDLVRNNNVLFNLVSNVSP